MLPFEIISLESNTLYHTSPPHLQRTPGRILPAFSAVHSPLTGTYVWKSGLLNEHYRAGATYLLTWPGAMWFFSFSLSWRKSSGGPVFQTCKLSRNVATTKLRRILPGGPGWNVGERGELVGDNFEDIVVWHTSFVNSVLFLFWHTS